MAAPSTYTHSTVDHHHKNSGTNAILAILIVAILILAAYFIFYRSPAPATDTGNDGASINVTLPTPDNANNSTDANSGGNTTGQ